jgi:hypothetical protein
MRVPHSRQSKLEVVVHEKQHLVLKTVTSRSHGWSKLCTGRGALSCKVWGGRFNTLKENSFSTTNLVNVMCRVKPMVGGILKIRGLGQGDSQVWPCILGMSPTHGLYLS